MSNCKVTLLLSILLNSRKKAVIVSGSLSGTCLQLHTPTSDLSYSCILLKATKIFDKAVSVFLAFFILQRNKDNLVETSHIDPTMFKKFNKNNTFIWNLTTGEHNYASIFDLRLFLNFNKKKEMFLFRIQISRLVTYKGY